MSNFTVSRVVGLEEERVNISSEIHICVCMNLLVHILDSTTCNN